MSLPSRFFAYKLNANIANEISQRRSIEVYLDLACPFSKKMFTVLANSDIQFIFRHQVQPWHPQSSLLHYVLIAVNKHNPESFYKAVKILFEHQEDFFDANVQDLSPKDIYGKAIHLLSRHDIHVDTKLFEVGEGNSGSALVPDMKYHIKISRQLGVHVSPTVFIDGLEDPWVSSSWPLAQWIEHLHK
eukprot:NODE_30_length_37342_cov_0.449507.p22 type:complete len:188 gc:universal NODE_30_length_37342_cov_0.449507:4671-4108(-)